MLSLINYNHSYTCSKYGVHDFDFWLARSVNIPVLPALSHLTFLYHICLHILPVTAGKRTLLSLTGSHEGSAGRAQHQSQGPTL